ncbi:MAG: hypothetical protein R3277_12045 [Brumimicrobium sp.]|nr:hypothetical protein [Brumimicrobium sp.]
MDFPQYRKRFDSKSFYKILNERQFEEVQIVGQKIFIHRINADKYFEIIQVRDMLECSGDMYLSSTEEEFLYHSESE